VSKPSKGELLIERCRARLKRPGDFVIVSNMTVSRFRDYRTAANFMPWRLSVRQAGPHLRVVLKERGVTERLRACAVGQILRFDLPHYSNALQTASRLKRQEGLVFAFHKQRPKGVFTARRMS
jgi:hypothetical protein